MIGAAFVTPGAITALLVGVGLATWNLYLTRRASGPRDRIAQLERIVTAQAQQLRHCRRVNRWLRQKNELVAAALLRLLPQEERLELLAAVGDRVLEPDAGEKAPPFELDEDDRRWLDDDEGMV